MGKRRWAYYLGAGCFLGALGLFLGPVFRRGLTELVGWTGVILTFRRAKRLEGVERRPWIALSVAGAFFMVGAVARLVHGALMGETSPYPSPADPLYFLSYAALIFCVVELLRLRAGGSDREGGALDALIVAAGAAVLEWVLVLAPYVRDGHIGGSQRLLTTIYSLMTLVLIGFTTRLAVAPGTRTVSYYLLASAMWLTLIADVSASLAAVGRASEAIPQTVAPFIFAFFGAAALHPDAQRLTEQPTESPDRLSWQRLLLLGSTLVVTPALTIFQLRRGSQLDLIVILLGWVVLAALVLLRLAELVRAKERAARQERVLTRAGQAMVSATTRAGMSSGALTAVAELCRSTQGFRASMATSEGSDLRVVEAVGRRAEEAIDTRIAVDELPAPLADALADRRSAWIHDMPAPDLPPDDIDARTVLLTPLVSQNERRGAIVVSTDSPLPIRVRMGIESLASMVSLALESAALSEDMHRRQSERRFRALVQQSSDIVIVLDMIFATDDARISFVSPAAQHLLGLDDEDVVGHSPYDFVHPDDAGIVRNLFEQVLSGQRVLKPVEIRLLHADGDHRWFEIRVRDLRDDPELAAVVVNAREVNDRKHAEQEMGRREARFRALVQHSSDIVAVVDVNGELTYVSPGVLEVLGYQPAELEGTPLSGLLNAHDAAAIRRRQQDLSDQGPGQVVIFPTATMEVQVTHRNGGRRTLDVTVTDLRDEEAVGGVVVNARDVTVRKDLEHDLRHQAMHDSLTGLGNRAMFLSRVEDSLRSADGRLIATLFIDLDDFKTVNDSLGHGVGDQLLQRVAQRVTTCLNHNDVAARLGGDEFAIVIQTSYGEEEVTKIADRLLLALRSPFTILEREITVTASVGIAYRDPSSTAELLLRNADMAMYLAKERGKDRYEVFEQDMHASVFERLVLKADLAHGIESGELRLCYQPIVSLQTGRVTGVEALVRWDHPTRGRLGPAQFVALAEDTGLIVPLGRWVLHEACRQLRAWQLRLPATATLSMSINLSVRQLLDDDIVQEVAETIHQYQLDPSTITMELTESMLMVDVDRSLDRLAGLRTLGVSLAIDDFGTGYSSLGYVQQFPIDIIKIDRSFVENMHPRRGGKTVVVQTMIELAQRLDVHIVAEGIEDAEQLKALQALGCDLGQGYYFSEPVEAHRIGPLLASSIVDGDRLLHPLDDEHTGASSERPGGSNDGLADDRRRR